MEDDSSPNKIPLKDISLKGIRIPTSIKQQLRQTRKKVQNMDKPTLMKKRIKPIGLRDKDFTPNISNKPNKPNKSSPKGNILSNHKSNNPIKGILSRNNLKKNKTFRKVRFNMEQEGGGVIDGVFKEPPRLKMKNTTLKNRKILNIQNQGVEVGVGVSTGGILKKKESLNRKTFKVRFNDDTSQQLGVPSSTAQIKEENKSKNETEKENIIEIMSVPQLKDRGGIYTLSGTPDSLISALDELTRDTYIDKN
jgi:hypothetical protein